MAELDDKLLKNLDATLQNMNTHLQNLEQTLAGVRGGMIDAFNPSILQSWTDSLRGLKAFRLIDAEQASKDIKKVESELSFWKDALAEAKKSGSPIDVKTATDELARLKQLMADINKGSEQRAIELANISQKEIDAAQKVNLAWTKAYDAEEKARIKARSKESRETYQKYFKQEEVKDANRRNQADRESLNIQRRQIQIKAEMAAIDKKRATEGKQLTSEEKARYREISAELTKLIARQKELDAISQGSGKRARGRLSKYEISESEKAMRRYGNAVQDARNKQQGLNNETSKMLPTIQRLASAFGVAFSVRGLAQFGKKLIETRGEFERQQVALRSILQNKQLADEIWEKTMQAALQSPFTAMQLTTYTKQLAAYRIETDKLFETTKRLADVSAGLGVDMQRLILAYGQVKAANYLRASEIRQFTEAGVNVLGELRDYFNEVKGMSVDTAKVMEMVTKRLVTFEDVEAIFKRMTDQGGIFFEMQYVQSQTVRGQIAKLHDAYDQMLNSIGQANEGALKNMVSLLNSIVKNWQEFKTVIDLIAWPLIILSLHKFALGLIAVDAAAIKASTSMSRLTVAGAKTQLMFKRLFASIAAHPFIALGAAVAAVGVALLNHAKHVRDINKRYEDLMLRTYETQKNLDGLSDTLKNNLETMKEATKGSKEYNEASRENENIVKKLKDQYPELLQDIDLQKDGYERLIAKIKEYNDELENQIRLEYAARASFGQDDLTTNIADLQETQREREMQFLRNREKAEKKYLELKAQGKEAREKELDALIRNAKTWQEQYDILIEFERTHGARSSGYELPIGLSAVFGRDVKTRVKDLEKNIENEALVFNDIIRDQLKTINDDLGDDIQQFIKDNEEQISELFKDKEGAGWKNLNKQITKFFTAKGATTKEARQVIQDFLNEYLLVPIQLDWGGSDTTETATKELADWQKRVNEAIDKATADFNKKRATLSEDAKKNMPEIEVYKIKDPLKTLEDAQSEILKKLKEVREKIASYEVKGQVAIDDAEYQALKLTEQEMEQVRILLGAVAKVTGGGGHRENASKLISLIKEMRSEYDKLSKSAYGYAKSEEKVREAYADSVKAILGKAGITDYDFTTNEGMIAALEKVKTYATKLGKDAAAEVQKYIDQLETEIEINAQVKIREDFGKQMEEMFNNYELTIDLEKLDLPADELAGIFDFKLTTIDALRKKVEDFYYEQAGRGDDPEELVKQVEGLNKKIDEMERKALVERLKKYTSYLSKGRDEAVKIHLEELKAMAEIDDLYDRGMLSEEMHKSISSEIRKETNEKLAKQTWKDFKESDYYTTMFQDLDHVASSSVDLMIKRLKKLQGSMSDLDPTQVKEIVQSIEKLENQKRQRSPFKSFIEDIKTWSNWNKKSEENDKWLNFYTEGEDYWLRQHKYKAAEVAQLEQEYNKLALDGEEENAAAAKNRWEFAKEELDDINERLEKYGLKIAEINDENNKGYAAMRRVLSGVAQGAQYFSEMASAAGTIATEMMDMFDGVDDASKKLAKDVAEIATNVGILAADIVKAIASEGSDVSSMIDGLVRTWNIIRSSMSAAEVEINRTIEHETKKIEELEDTIDRLRRARDRAWDTAIIVYNEKEIEHAIEQQIEAYDAMISAEEQRKNKDESLLRQYRQEREDLFEQLQDEQEEFAQSFGGIGEGGFRDEAQGFVDAWKQAFLETGDGLQGLQDHFDEFLQEWFVKQATMRVASNMLEPLFRDIDAAVDKYGDGGTSVLFSELQRVRERFNLVAPQLSEALEELAGSWNLNGEGGLSGLAAGIQGMTEEQANILEAYWNSVRGYTASIDMNVARIAQILGAGGDNTNPQLQQLNLIAANTQATHQLLQSVTKSGHSQGGYGIKVFAD